MAASDPLTSNLEDYLEAIFFLVAESKAARAKDIARRLGVQRASVTGALQTLSQKGLIHYHPYSSVTLTQEGFETASRIVYRHEVLQRFLHLFLQLPPEVAESNACRLEHHIDDQALERLIAFVRFLQDCPRTGDDWLQAFIRSCLNEQRCGDCRSCVESCFRGLCEVGRANRGTAGDGGE
jgi:DtxR family Mn-dependent transcriptional regulator